MLTGGAGVDVFDFDRTGDSAWTSGKTACDRITTTCMPFLAWLPSGRALSSVSRAPGGFHSAPGAKRQRYWSASRFSPALAPSSVAFALGAGLLFVAWLLQRSALAGLASIALAAAFNPADLPFSNTGNTKYDKENLLTWLKNYVMHEGVDDDSLTKILESKHLGKVSLAAILALQQKPIGETSPKTLQTVLEGLSSVGLDDVARRILTELLLQQKLLRTGASLKTIELETETKENPNHGTSRSSSTTKTEFASVN